MTRDATYRLFEQADMIHRQHAVIETVFADLIDGPILHLPTHWP